MQIMKPTTALVLDTRREKKNGTYPVKVRVTFNREQQYYPTGIDLLPEEWEMVSSEKPRKEYKKIKETLAGIQGKAKEIIDDTRHFTFEGFDLKFYKKRSNKGALVDLFESYIDKLRCDGRISTANSYNNSLTSLKEFEKNLNFSTITSDFLEKYEKWMIGNGKSITTVGIYIRSLRTIFNEAIAIGEIGRELYPFGKRKYQIPASRNIKKALDIADIKLLYNYTTISNSTQERSRDLWMFSYLCYGINPKDICKLQFKHLKNDRIEFVRAKTARSTKTNSNSISIFLTDDAKRILNKWCNEDKSPDNYVFPFLKKGMSPQQEFDTVKQFVKTVNKYMKEIAKELNITKPITTYTARHSFSTILKRTGASVEFISEALGHADIKTTQSYLGSFEKDTHQKITKNLLSFKK